MDEELKLFRIDSDEQLTFMENALITMQEDGADDDNVGALFRAMHTIKGTAGMFNFDDVVEFAHIAENLLSEVRDHNVKLTPDMIDIFFKVKDHTQTLIDLTTDNEPIDEFTKATSEELVKILKSNMPSGKEIDEIEIDAQDIQDDDLGDIEEIDIDDDLL